MTKGTDAFSKPLKSTQIVLDDSVTYAFSARLLENELINPVITEFDFMAPFGSIDINKEGMLLVSVSVGNDNPKVVAHALFRKTDILVLLEICTDIGESRLEIESIIWSAVERLTALDLIIPNDMNVVRDTLLPIVPTTKKMRGIAEILVREHLERKRLQVLHSI